MLHSCHLSTAEQRGAQCDVIKKGPLFNPGVFIQVNENDFKYSVKIIAIRQLWPTNQSLRLMQILTIFFSRPYICKLVINVAWRVFQLL